MSADYISNSDRMRFFAKVEKLATEAGCWIWMSATRGHGYGSFAFNKKCVGAHRLSWEMENGPIPNGMAILHCCDTPLCVRPDHLRLGTQLDNIEDRERKGRGNISVAWEKSLTVPRHKGEDNASSKLTNELVLRIRETHALGGVTQKQLSQGFKVSHSLINQIILRRIWKHI